MDSANTILKKTSCGLVALLLLGGLAPAAAQDCDMTGAYIVNLSQDEIDRNNNCLRFDDAVAQRSCVRDLLLDNLPQACRRNFDIFVPGSNQEYGAWKQFNYIFNSDNDRAHLSIQYEDAREVDNDLIDLDLGKYDQGVIDAKASLELLLDTILGDVRLGGSGADVRVFGHSKGSHAVALASEGNAYRNVEFYAFAQAARTAVDISSRSDIRPGKLGDPGYIHKLTDNLIGITWRNDEVQWMVGNGFSAGTEVPEMWGFPGYIKDERTSGTNPIIAEAFRIDHHNNYGGFYEDGRSDNDWREGEGSKDDGWPYCATGDKVAWDSNECDEGNVRFAPWFWGHHECRMQAFSMMKGAPRGSRYYIGYSGPRDRYSCRESERLIRVNYEMRYRWDVSDNQCVNKVQVEFRSLDGEQHSSFTVRGSEDNDGDWLIRRGSLNVPPHLMLRLDADLEEDGGNCSGPAQTELWINYLRLDFSHPGLGGNIDRTIIGFSEGNFAPPFTTLDNYLNTGWEQPDKSSEEYRMYFTESFNSIKLEVRERHPANGNFRKRVHLLD